jgi:hypothetical protein
MKELELFSLGGLGSMFGRNKHNFVLQPGQKCLNCDTELSGRYCHVCGQDADTHHRTIFHLIFEAFEGLFHVDGRLWQTLPPLFFAPGKLARDFMEGRVTRHVPPFRIFLVTLLVFMFVAEHKTEEARHHHDAAQSADLHAAVHDITQAAAEDSAEAPPKTGARLAVQGSDENSTRVTTTGEDGKTVTRNIKIFSMSEEDAKYLAGVVKDSNIRPQWLKDDLVKALSNPERFFTSVFTWGHRLALLLLPIIGLSLGLLYSGKKHKRFFLYDHLLISMNLLSFIFLTNAIEFMLPEIVRPGSRHVLWVWTMVNFFLTLRGAYGSSILGAILKSIILWIMTIFGFGIVLATVMFVSLTT